METSSLRPVEVETFLGPRWGERSQAGRRVCSRGAEGNRIQEVKIVAIACSSSDSAPVLPAAGVCWSLIRAGRVPSLPGPSEPLPQAPAYGLLPRGSWHLPPAIYPPWGPWPAHPAGGGRWRGRRHRPFLVPWARGIR